MVCFPATFSHFIFMIWRFGSHRWGGGKGDWADSHLYNDCQSEDFMTWCHFATGVRNPFVDLWFPKPGMPVFSWSKSHVVGVSLALYSSEAKILFGQERAYLALATVYQGLSADRRKIQKGLNRSSYVARSQLKFHSLLSLVFF